MQNPAALEVSAFARSVAKTTYEITRPFPAAERFGLTAQMRKAAISIGSNIYEGCGRRSAREFTHFLHVALGSASELEFQLLAATDLGFLSSDAARPLAGEVVRIKKMLSRLIISLRTRESRTARD